MALYNSNGRYITEKEAKSKRDLKAIKIANGTAAVNLRIATMREGWPPGTDWAPRKFDKPLPYVRQREANVEFPNNV